MENYNDYKKNQSGLERLNLLMYSVYNFIMSALAVRAGWSIWIPFLMMAAMVASWLVYAAKYKDYAFRTKFTAMMIQVSFILYAMHTEDLFSAFPILICLAIMLGLYGTEDALKLTWVTMAFLLFYHCFIAKNISFSSEKEILRMLLQTGNFIFAELILTIWVKKRNQSNRQHMKTIADLREAEQIREDFLANVSHEIRTPVNTIGGMSAIILQENNLEKIRENAFSIQDASRKLTAVVGDILDFSKLQSGNITLEEEAYNITSTLNDVINIAVLRKAQKNIELIVNCDADIPCGLYGDEKKIRRIMLNVLDNAIKFTEEGGVSISISHRRESYGINLMITVKDTGIGINEQGLEQLFTGFHQNDSKRNRKVGGVGLGLPISKALAQQMGGFLTVKSPNEKGTIVKIVIPQKIVEDYPIVEIKNRKEVHAAVYIDMEQFEIPAIRDEYFQSATSIVKQLHAKCHICRNLNELKRRGEYENFSHIFITLLEYQEDMEYFNNLSTHTHVCVLIDRWEEKYISNPHILHIYKPFSVLSVVSLLNGEAKKGEETMVRSNRFISPDTKVLVVDDNLMNIKVIKGLLENYKIKVSMAQSGKEALEKIEEQDFDFVFMDHMMPEMDGIETLHNIRKKVGTYYQKVPVIVLTANAIAGRRELFIKAGFADFLEKPVELSVLERVLKRNIPKEKIITIEEAENDPEDREESREEKIHVGDLDVEKGIIYCGGRENYINILRMYLQNGRSDIEQIKKLYEEQDWKNYTIKVHSIKSSMMSIGAMALAEMSKQIEAAGKQGRVDYIHRYHRELMEEYKRILHLLADSPLVNLPAKEQEELTELPILPEEEFSRRMTAFEDAAYALDGQKMQEILADIRNYRYGGVSLKEALEPIARKVEMLDYLSAQEALKKFAEQMQQKRGGEA